MPTLYVDCPPHDSRQINLVTAYQDYVIDLPQRCIELLNSLDVSATTQGKEISLLLMASSMAFVVPFERLRVQHPSGDAGRFKDLSLFLTRSLGASFGLGDLSPPNPDAWKHGRVDQFGDGPDSWVASERPVVDQPLSYVLGVIRNALCHANLFTRGNPIHSFTFFSECRSQCPFHALEGYKFLSVPVGEFRSFILNWFVVLAKFKGGYRHVLEEIARAA